MQKRLRILISIVAVLVLAVGIYYLPPVHSRLAWRVDDLRAQIKYFFNPPEQAEFVPAQQAQLETIVAATMQALPTPSPTVTPIPPSEGPTATPTITPTPLPLSVSLPGVVYVDQNNRWNYCGPSNLTMALNFWGWKGSRDDVAKVIKPGVNDPNLDFIQRGKTDKNIMPYEMAGFVEDHTDLNVVIRHGGDVTLLKRLIASGFPALIEKGYYTVDTSGKYSWMGHYLFITGYDESQQSFITQDTYPPKGVNGENRLFAYNEVIQGWRAFDYLFLVVYPPERESELLTLLGPWADPKWAVARALEINRVEAAELNSADKYFALFSIGTAHVYLQQYAEAALVYDQAFQLYATLPDDWTRPYRMMWYQTGPYWAYYYTGRYPDVIDLANITLNDTISEPVLEESLYWRAMAKYALGQYDAAYTDMRQAVYLNPHFQAGLAKLQEWGISQ